LKNAPNQASSRYEKRKEEPELKDAQSKKQRLPSTSKYINTLCVAPVSNIREQLFSRAKHIIMTPTRRRMDPSTLEDIFILKFNTDLWSAQLVQTILQEEKD